MSETGSARESGNGDTKSGIELLLVLGCIWLGVMGVRLWRPDRIDPEPRRAVSPNAAFFSDAGASPPPSTSATPKSPDTSPQRILIVGDSMLDGLLPRLADYGVENGHSVSAVIWYGSRTIDWAHTSRLRDALRDFRPTYVILAIGSSELTIPYIEKRAPAVRQILKDLGDRKLIWIGPPNWRTDTGIGALLEREVGAQRYFRSLDLHFERRKDGIHPTLESSRKWMDAVAAWIVTSSDAPILLNLPHKTGSPRPMARVFPPPSQ